MQFCYRSRQWWRSLGAELPAADRALVRAHLSQPQRTLFAALLPRDQVHAIAVYRAILRDHPDATDDPDVAVAALLHDAGKAGTRLCTASPTCCCKTSRRGCSAGWRR